MGEQDQKDLTNIETLEIPNLTEEEANKKEQEKIENLIAGGI